MNSAVLGEGSFSICRKGVDIETGEEVAIKEYKAPKKGDEQSEHTTLAKFRRQVQVLTELQKPWAAENNLGPTMCHDQLQQETPGRLFMQVIDYSTGEDGEPGP